MRNQSEAGQVTQAAIGCVLALALGVGACTNTRNQVPAPALPTPTGDVALTLKVSMGVQVDAATYQISGNGITPLTGSIPLIDPAATASTVVGGIPAGLGYQFQIDATSTDGKTVCHGSAVADVIAGATTGVTIIAQCRRIDGQLGGVVIIATVNNCPHVTGVVASPLATSVGGSINLSAAASDLDGHPLNYHWSTPTGTLSNDSGPATTFTCTHEGAVSLTLAVSDGNCQDQQDVAVSCLPFCAVRPDGTPCDDQSACTSNDHCQGGVCAGADVVVCTALDQCHDVGVCDPQTAVCSQPPSPDGTACLLPNASAACAAGACGLKSCTGGFGNCDGDGGNGCEVSLQISPANCGACGFACPAGAACAAGLCLSPPPTNVAASAGGWTVSVSWQPALAATGYQIQRATQPAGPFAAIGLTTGATSFVDEAVVSGTTYFYAVASKSVGGVSDRSMTASATPVTKQLCVTSSQGHAVVAYGANQSGRAMPVRTIAGPSTGFGFPKGLASSPAQGELFVSLQGGVVNVFALSASGNVAPAWTLSGASGGLNAHAIDVDTVAGEVFTAEYETGGKVNVLAAEAGTLKRVIAGAQTGLGHVSSIVVDRVHDELLVGQQEPGGAFQQVLTYQLAASGNAAPRRTLGIAASPTGGWAVAHDGVTDELFTTCNCNNQIAVHDRTATGAAPPKRTMQIAGLSAVYSLLVDPGSETLWAIGNSGFTSVMLVEVPRGASGSVMPLRPGITLSMIGRLARCN